MGSVSRHVINNKNDLYAKNMRSLGFLPKLFSVCLLIILVAGFSWYYVVQSNLEVNLVDSNIDNFGLIENSDVLGVTDIKSKQNSNLRIHQNNLQNCVLKPGLKPDYLDDKFTNLESGWWLPEEGCFDNNLQAIQVLTAQNSNTLNIPNEYNLDNFQLLDPERRVYAVVYQKEDVSTAYNLQRFLKPLYEGVFNDFQYLAAEDVFNTVSLDNFTYYLSGGCIYNLDTKCSLWSRDNFSGEIELLTYDILSTLGVQNLENSQMLNFTKIHDVVNSINIMVVDWSRDYNVINVISLDLKNLSPIQSQILMPRDSEYSQYI